VIKQSGGEIIDAYPLHHKEELKSYIPAKKYF
jgi:hypothetical protein